MARGQVNTRTAAWERVVLFAGDAILLDVRRLAVTQGQVDQGLVELGDDGKAEAERSPPSGRS